MNMKKKMVVLLGAVLVMGSITFADTTATGKTLECAPGEMTAEPYYDVFEDIFSKEDNAKYNEMMKKLNKLDDEKDEKAVDAVYDEMDKLFEKYEDQLNEGFGEEDVDWDSEGEDYFDFDKELENILSKEDYANYNKLMEKVEKLDFEKNEKEVDALFTEMDKILEKYDDKLDFLYEGEEGEVDTDFDADFEKEIQKVFSKEDYAKYTELTKKIEQADQGQSTEIDALYEASEKIFSKYETQFEAMTYQPDPALLKALTSTESTLYKGYLSQIQIADKAGKATNSDGLWEKIGNLYEKYEDKIKFDDAAFEKQFEKMMSKEDFKAYKALETKIQKIEDKMFKNSETYWEQIDQLFEKYSEAL